MKLMRGRTRGTRNLSATAQRRLAFCVLVAMSAAAPAPAAGLDGLDQATGCHFRLPAGWNYPVDHWNGDCALQLGEAALKVADGEGVLVAYVDGKPVQAFYGSMHFGEIELGVIEGASGFKAGRFSAGRPIDTDSQRGNVEAFLAASRAAAKVAALFLNADNIASAKFYAGKVKLFEHQVAD